ncbi:MAG: nucleotidyltransferase domain-containing protein [Armatimonadetes bacterium]|nr:nucleotidyltransferase domain-containing protein [Armatimonadota bacterium]
MRALDQVELSDQDRLAVEAAARLLRERYPVEEVILYGSKARGDDTPESDIDLLVLTSCALSQEMRAQLRHDVIDVGWEHDVLISPLVRDREEWLHGIYQVLPIRHEVERDGVVVP